METTIEHLNNSVFATLKPSRFHGVGVFAIRDIPKGQQITDYSIHTINNTGFLKVSEAEFEQIHPAIRKLILDRSLFNDEQKNFYFFSPNMEVCLTSFMNHSDEANSDGKIALKDILEGEEITENYTVLYGDKKPHPFIKKHYSSFLTF